MNQPGKCNEGGEKLWARPKIIDCTPEQGVGKHFIKWFLPWWANLARPFGYVSQLGHGPAAKSAEG